MQTLFFIAHILIFILLILSGFLMFKTKKHGEIIFLTKKMDHKDTKIIALFLLNILLLIMLFERNNYY